MLLKYSKLELHLVFITCRIIFMLLNILFYLTYHQIQGFSTWKLQKCFFFFLFETLIWIFIYWKVKYSWCITIFLFMSPYCFVRLCNNSSWPCTKTSDKLELAWLKLKSVLDFNHLKFSLMLIFTLFLFLLETLFLKLFYKEFLQECQKCVCVVVVFFFFYPKSFFVLLFPACSSSIS